MSVKLLTEHQLEFLSLKGGSTGSSESTHVKMPHCWKSHVVAQKITVTCKLFSTQCPSTSNATLGFIQGSLSKIQGLFKTILQFSRTKSFRKILIEVFKFFKNARLR